MICVMFMAAKEYMLDAKVLESQPSWWRNIDPDEYYLVLGDDMDSLLSCLYLQKKFKGLQIGGFFDFKKGLYVNKEITKGKEPIYVDCSMLKEKCFDNHMTFFTDENPQMINPNKNRESAYNQKYNGSVIAFLLALYDQDMSIYNENMLQRLLCIDSFFRGIYKQDGRYAHVNYAWFDLLGMLDVLQPLTDKLTEKDFEEMIDNEGIHRHFEINEDGYIQIVDHPDSKMKNLPKHKFELVMPVIQDRTKPNCSEAEIRQLVKEKSVISLAQTYANTYQYSYLSY